MVTEYKYLGVWLDDCLNLKEDMKQKKDKVRNL